MVHTAAFPVKITVVTRRRRPSLDLPESLESWLRHLRAEAKSGATITLYDRGVRAFLAWCKAEGRAAVLERETVTAFIADLLAAGREPATARAYQLAVRLFAVWLVDEGELPADPLVGLKPPKLDAKVVPVLSTDQIKALLAACQGKQFRDRRDEAMVRLMLETGMRAGECVALTTDDLDLGTGMATVRRGKGGKGRRVAFGPQTARALDRYLRLRRSHKLAASGRLWLADNGRSFGYDGLRKTLVGRARIAGISGFHPHVLQAEVGIRMLPVPVVAGHVPAPLGMPAAERLRQAVAHAPLQLVRCRPGVAVEHPNPLRWLNPRRLHPPGPTSHGSPQTLPSGAPNATVWRLTGRPAGRRPAHPAP
jgi:site-specific recombinase XerD